MLSKCQANEQYSRREWQEILQIPEFVQADNLGESISKLFNECLTPVDSQNIEACRRLKSKAKARKVVRKLSKRNDTFKYEI